VAILATVTGMGAVTTAWIYGTAAILGLAYAVAIPTMHALIPGMIPARDLGPAVGLTAVTFNLARVLGPVLAAVALATVSYAMAFGLNGLSFVALIVALMLIKVRPRPEGERRGSLREGLRYAWRDRNVRAMLIAITALAFAIDPVNTLTPAFAVDVFHRPNAAAPLLISAFGLGSILAALGLGRLFRKPTADVRLGAITMLMLGGGMAAFALSPSYPVALACLLFAGLGSLSSITIFTTAIQQAVPDELRGRVMALWTVCALGARFPAGIVDGVLGDAIGPRAAALLILAPLALCVLFLIPRLTSSSPGRSRRSR
jgi:MFS family permease